MVTIGTQTNMVLSVEVEEVGCNERKQMNGGSVDLMSEGAKVGTMKSDRAVRSESKCLKLRFSRSQKCGGDIAVGNRVWS